jgi:hypothetical protein
MFEDIERRNLFQLGKFGMIVCIIAWGFLMFTNTIDMKNDFRAYYNFW